LEGSPQARGSMSITDLRLPSSLTVWKVLRGMRSNGRLSLPMDISRYLGALPMSGELGRGRRVVFVDTLEGMRAHIEGQRVAIMKDYWKFRKLQSWERRTIPPRLYFRQYERATCP
jgi:hypothetical protein